MKARTVTIRPGSANLIAPEGKATIRNIGPTPVWHSHPYGMDQLMHPGGGALVIKAPTLFAVIPSSKHSADLEVS